MSLAFRAHLAGLCVQEGGAVFVSDEALAAAAGYQLDVQEAQGGVVVRIGGAAPASPLPAYEPPAAPAAPEPVRNVLEAVVNEEVDVEVIDDDTPEGRAARYIATRQGPAAAAAAARRPAKRVWDDPEDLQWQDAGTEQPEREGGELMQNDGSIRINA